MFIQFKSLGLLSLICSISGVGNVMRLSLTWGGGLEKGIFEAWNLRDGVWKTSTGHEVLERM